MSVYIDDFNVPFRNMIMCHMMADSTEELIEMARKIGVNPKWIQRVGSKYEHFDICLSKKKLAIENGAIEVSSEDLVKRFRLK